MWLQLRTAGTPLVEFLLVVVWVLLLGGPKIFR